jgi:hypothetical protein
MLHKDMVKGMDITNKARLTSPCKPCLMGKQTCAEISKVAEERSNIVLRHVFLDVSGRQATHLHHGYEYYMSFINDKSRKVSVAGI